MTVKALQTIRDETRKKAEREYTRNILKFAAGDEKAMKAIARVVLTLGMSDQDVQIDLDVIAQVATLTEEVAGLVKMRPEVESKVQALRAKQQETRAAWRRGDASDKQNDDAIRLLSATSQPLRRLERLRSSLAKIKTTNARGDRTSVGLTR